MLQIIKHNKGIQWKQSQLDNIGKTWETKTGSKLTVVGIIGKSKNCKIIYNVECSVCSKDTQLFPFKYFPVISDGISSGTVPCNCSGKYKPSQEQYIVLVERVCKERGYSFHGFAEKFCGCNTKLTLENLKTGNVWNTTSLQSFLLLGTGDPLEKSGKLKEAFTMPDKYFIDRFMGTGKFLSGAKFKRLERCFWEYTCPVCSQDEYVQAGVCSGVFTSTAGHYIDRGPNCRCAKGYRWSEAQRNFQLTNLCKSEGLTFKGWTTQYKSNKSKFVWYCKEGHRNETSISNFLKGRRCKDCAKNGFNKNKKGFLYLSRWSNHKVSYIKFGITNNPVPLRIRQQELKSTLTPEVLYVFEHSLGRNILSCEGFIKDHMKTRACPKELLPRGFTETVEDTPENLSKLLEIISTSNLHPS